MNDDSQASDLGLRARQAALIADLHLREDTGNGSPGVVDDARLTALVHQAATVTGMARATINLLDGDRQCQVSAHGFAAADTPREESLCAQVTGWEPDVYAFTDLATEPGFTGNPWVDGRRARVRAYASAPLIIDGTTIGTLCVFDEQPRALSLAQCDGLAELAAAVVDLLHHRRAAVSA